LQKLSVQLDAGVLLHVEQLPKAFPFRCGRDRRGSLPRSDAAIFFSDQILGGQFFSLAVAPFFRGTRLCRKFRKRLRQPVGQASAMMAL